LVSNQIFRIIKPSKDQTKACANQPIVGWGKPQNEYQNLMEDNKLMYFDTFETI